MTPFHVLEFFHNLFSYIGPVKRQLQLQLARGTCRDLFPFGVSEDSLGRCNDGSTGSTRPAMFHPIESGDLILASTLGSTDKACIVLLARD